MPISDGQIAIGILQLVALSLPVFAILAQVYFTFTDDEPRLVIGIILFAGGGFLLLGALFSVQYLWTSTSSLHMSSSLIFISLGLVFIAILLFTIFRESTEEIQDLRQRAERFTTLAERLIPVMEERGVETISELRGTGFDVSNDIRDELTLNELREVKDESTDISDALEDYQDLFSPRKLKRRATSDPLSKLTIILSSTQFYLIVIAIIAIGLISYFTPISFVNPLAIFGLAVLGWFYGYYAGKSED